MRPRLALLLAGVATAAALSAGLVVAQTMTMPQDAPPPGAAPAPATPPPPPAAVLPPQETAPPAAPAPDAKTADKPSSPDADSGDQAKGDSAPAGEAKPEAPAVDPAKRQVFSSAVIQALDKITAETMRFEVTAGHPVRWKGLVFTLKACETSAPDEPVKDSMAFLQVRSDPSAQSEEASREIFRGWMYAGAPAMNPLKHPVYDAWLVACRT